MQYKVEDLDQLTKNISVTVPAKEVNAMLDRVASRFRSGMSVPGFRKGKAPLKMIEKMNKKEIYSEATNMLVDEQVRNIISELKLEPALDPSFNAELMERGNEYAYSFKIELMPVFELPDYNEFPVEQQEAQVKDEEIDGIIERARKDMAEVLPVLDKRNPQDGDLVNLDFTGYDEEGKEVPGFKAENAQIPLGDNQAFENFENLIKTVPMGEEGEGEVEFPADFPNREMAGKKMTFKLKINALHERRLPEADDEFAKRAGNFESMDKLREMIRNSFMESRNQTAKTAAQQSLLEGLMEKTDFPLPKGLVDHYTQVARSEIMNRIGRSGPQAVEMLKDQAKINEEAVKDAERYVRSSIFLFRVAEAEEIKVTEQEIQDQVRLIAQQQGKKPEEMLEELYRNGSISSVQERILTSKALDALYEKAKVTVVKHPAGIKVVKVKSRPGDAAEDKDKSDGLEPDNSQGEDKATEAPDKTEE